MKDKCVLIVESTLKNQAGHQFNAVIQIKDAFERLGYKTVLIGPKNSEIQSIPLIKKLPVMPVSAWQKLLFLKHIHSFQLALAELTSIYNPQFLLFPTGDSLINLLAISRLAKPCVIVFHTLTSNIQKILLKGSSLINSYDVN